MQAFGDMFKDKLDTVLDAAIADQFLERQQEREEGPTELGNPHVISQPVHHSQFPSGQPRNVLAGGFNLITALLIGGAVLTLLLTVLVLRR